MYFNHAFRKMFLGIHADNVEAYNGDDLVTAGTDAGFITTTNKVGGGSPVRIHSGDLQNFNLGPGVYGFFDPKTYEIQQAGDIAGCCPLVLVSSAIRTQDKYGPFHGGYQESNKSKVINPKFVHKYYKVAQCTPEKAVLSIGHTPYTVDAQITDAECCKEFYCGETYYLRVDVKGSPALRFLNHNMYKTFDHYTGCCPGDVPTIVDPTLVYLGWAKQMTQRDNENWNNMVLPVVYDWAGGAWYKPGTTVSPIDGSAVLETQWWEDADGNDNYAGSAAGLAWDPDTYTCDGSVPGAGMRIVGAYVETKFQNCTFECSDHFELEPLQIYASLVDYTGDPCLFEGLCVYDECKGLMGQGFGEQVIRDLILHESYLQNFFATDKRIREITGGNDNFIVDRISSGVKYTRYFIQHTVPRYNNPTGTFDNDQYLLEIVTEGDSAALETFLEAWLDTACSACETLETYDCAECTPADEPGPFIP